MSKKGYWIAEVDITDAEAFAGYVARVGPLLEKFGAKTIVRNGRSRSPEHPAGGHHVIVEFESFEAALACYQTPEYTELVALRAACSTTRFVIIEGL